MTASVSGRRPRPDADADLIDVLRRGDQGAADALVVAHGARIHRTANRILANAADADEVAQDVLLTIVRRIEAFDGRSVFTTWVHRVATNAALARLRRRRRDDARAGEVPALLAVAGVHGPGADEELARRELGAALARAIEALPEPYRLPLILGHCDGLSTGAIAERLGLGRAAVKSRMYRSRLLVRARLAAYVAA